MCCFGILRYNKSGNKKRSTQMRKKNLLEYNRRRQHEAECSPLMKKRDIDNSLENMLSSSSSEDDILYSRRNELVIVPPTKMIKSTLQTSASEDSNDNNVVAKNKKTLLQLASEFRNSAPSHGGNESI